VSRDYVFEWTAFDEESGDMRLNSVSMEQLLAFLCDGKGSFAIVEELGAPLELVEHAIMQIPFYVANYLDIQHEGISGKAGGQLDTLPRKEKR